MQGTRNWLQEIRELYDTATFVCPCCAKASRRSHPHGSWERDVLTR